MAASERAISPPHSAAARFLAGELHLEAATIALLERQGFVQAEQRSPSSIVYKLRFRSQGRQHVRYLGTDNALAERVREALKNLRRRRECESQLSQLAGQVGRRLRSAKGELAPLLHELGYHFHGQAIRRRRNREIDPENAKLEAS
jgi:hypothetical protein